jgi:hypothetical protein
MRGLIHVLLASAIISVLTAAPGLADDHNAIVIVYKDGHRQTLSSSAVARIDLKAPAAIVYKNGRREKIGSEIQQIEFGAPTSASLPGRSHFIGKWELGQGGGGHFFVTLEENGTAKKSIGPTGGTWTLVDGEAHITWDDGWHDAIRKVGGGKHEKVAFEPGKSFNDEPSNVDYAKSLQAKSI